MRNYLSVFTLRPGEPRRGNRMPCPSASRSLQGQIHSACRAASTRAERIVENRAMVEGGFGQIADQPLGYLLLAGLDLLVGVVAGVGIEHGFVESLIDGHGIEEALVRHVAVDIARQVVRSHDACYG